MNENDNSVFTLKASKSPYIVNGIIWLPIMAFGFYTYYISGIINVLYACLFLLCFPLYLLIFLNSLSFKLYNNKIIYREFWNVKELPLDEVKAIKYGPMLYHVKVRWLVEAKDASKSFIAIIANFDAKNRKLFIKKLRKIAPNIDVKV